MKLSIFCPFGLKAPIHALKIVFFSGDFTPKIGSNVNKTSKRHICGSYRFWRCINYVSIIVPEKSRGNKKCDKEEEERHIFGLFGIAVKWP